MSKNRDGFGRLVWVTDPNHGFQLCKLSDIGTDTMSVEPIAGGPIITENYENVFPADENQKKDFDDNCALMYLNEATLLNNCRLRYLRGQIYTYVANILISINPYEQIPELYSSGTIRKYQGKSIGTLAPHIFAIADNSYREMRRQRQSQSIIVSGESGAGKTESQKCILRFLCESWGSTAGPIEQRILETNPILEAFGNAKTMRNNNSSRFGKFVEIHFSPKYTVAGGFISHYLLEKSRVCRQLDGERNYHIFYQLIAGADQATAQRLQLRPIDSYNYLNGGCIQFFADNNTSKKILNDRRSNQADLRDELVDDYANFHSLQRALRDIGLSEDDLSRLLDVIAAVLHLGNISFTEKDENSKDKSGGCMVDPSSAGSVRQASILLGLDETDLRSGLTSRIMQPPKGGLKGTIIRVPLKRHEAAAARDALAKAVYSKLFDTIVATINRCIPFGDSNSYIGVLDIAGFEFFKINSFEQFCINYCNEKLQNFFNDRILKEEQQLYAREGLNVDKIEFSDNDDCIDLFERRIDGLLDLLDEEARLPCPSVQHFTSSAHQKLKNHFRLTTPRRSKLREHRDIRDDEGFLIRHFAGSVCYQTGLFLEKNNDALHSSLEMLMDSSGVKFVRDLFTSEADGRSINNNSRGNSGSKATGMNGNWRSNANKLAFTSVSSKFRSQLTQLLKKLEHTNTHFVRCIKPNSEMRAGHFHGSMILSQLKCAGMTSVLKLMQNGYPSRTSFDDLYRMYQKIMPSHLARLDARLFCKCLFHALGLNDKDFKFGQTKVFFRPGKFAEFDQMLRQDPAHMEQLIRKVQSWLLHVRWKRAQFVALSCIKLKNKILYRAAHLIKIQSALRGFRARKAHLPRLHLYHQVSTMLLRVTELEEPLKRMSPASRQKWLSTIDQIKINAQALLNEIKRSDVRRIAQLTNAHKTMVAKIDSTLASLRQQLAIDEQERIKELEAKQLLEKQRERQKRMDDERLEQQRIERRKIEEKRRLDEEEHQKWQLANEAQLKLQMELERKRLEELRQEKLDGELARRLAEEDGNLLLIESPSNTITEKQKSTSKYNLAQCKYAELRDIINTSTDTNLLLACKEEFHRRLQIYNQWKQRNQSSLNGQAQTSRMPMAVLAAAGRKSNITPAGTSIQRYFRVPFAKPISGRVDITGMTSGARAANLHGMWYAHFNGQWIARQMELYPDQKPFLLITGRDDMEMCELSLDATQLTRKKGAEITAAEFETIWQQCGGPLQCINGAYHPGPNRNVVNLGQRSDQLTIG